MPYPLPPALSPSRVTAFTDCALAFRFAVLDRLPEPPSPAATKGTLVHAALERLYDLPPAARTVGAAVAALGQAHVALRDDPDLTGLGLDEEAEAAFVADAERLVRRVFELEDPTRVRAVGLELKLQADVGGVALRGIIDRLDLTDDGELLVTDYKSGRAPSERFEKSKLEGVNVYALLVERVFGVRPVAVQLLYLGDPLAIICTPTEQSGRFVEQKIGAVWQTIMRANAGDSFKPKPGKLCDWCSYKTFCPAFGGDPDEARRVGEELRVERHAARGADADTGTLPDLAEPLPYPAAG